MKIVLICNAYPPEFVGGTELVVASQAKALMAAGHEVRVICGSEERREDFRPWIQDVDGVEVLRIAKTRVERSQAHWQFARMVRIVDEAMLDCDIAHVHHWASLSGDLVRRLARKHSVVLSLHDYYASCPRFFRTPLAGLHCPTSRPTEDCAKCVDPLVGQHGPGEVLARLNQRWSNFRAELQEARYVIVPSEHLRGALACQMDIETSHWQLIPHGLCQDLQRLPRRTSDDQPLTVISFGNRSSVKGTLDLVHAMAAMPEGSARLILPGSEVEAGFDDQLRAAAGHLELELSGRYDSSDLERYAAAADLAAFPSRAEESYGLVIEEALALGLPTWVSDRGALGEVLTNTVGRGALPGGVLPAENPSAWTRLLNELVQNPQKLQDARNLVPQRQKPGQHAVATQLELYQSILDGLPSSNH
jgi:glycosyltransferase involved in cell wall biosynthesis